MISRDAERKRRDAENIAKWQDKRALAESFHKTEQALQRWETQPHTLRPAQQREIRWFLE